MEPSDLLGRFQAKYGPGLRIADKALSGLSLAVRTAAAHGYARGTSTDAIVQGLIQTDTALTTALAGFGAQHASLMQHLDTLVKVRAVDGAPPLPFNPNCQTDLDEAVAQALRREDHTLTPLDILSVLLRGQGHGLAIKTVLSNAGLDGNAVLQEVVRLDRLSPGNETYLFYLQLVDDRIRLIGVQPSGVGSGGFRSHGRGLLLPTRSMHVALQSRYGLVTQDEVDEFEWLVNRSDVTEDQIQKFLERHPHFLLSDPYVRAHAQVVLHREEGPQLIPDFFLESASGFADLLEIKKPYPKLVVGTQSRLRVSAQVLEAAAQLREYRAFFDDQGSRAEFAAQHGFEVFRPRMTVLIGRSDSFSGWVQRRRLLDELQSLELITYDDILERAKRRAILLE